MTKRLTQEQFLERLRKVHGNTITTDDKYVNAKTKIIFHCNKGLGHPDWEARPNDILRGHQCHTCMGRNHNTNWLINLVNQKLGSDYCVVGEYKGMLHNTKIKHTNCGTIFDRKPHDIQQDSCGCPHCKSSRGERRVSIVLDANNIKYIREKHVMIKGKKHRFDFYLPEYNLLIEWDGKQHKDKSSQFYRGTYTDSMKNRWCYLTGVNLLRIPDNDENFSNLPNIIGSKIGIALKGVPYNQAPRYKQYMNWVNYTKSNGVKEASLKYGVDRHTISRQFKYIVGVTPEQYFGGKNASIKIKVKSTNTEGKQTVYSSISEAAKIVGIKFPGISKCLHGKQKTAGGYKWEYAE